MKNVLVVLIAVALSSVVTLVVSHRAQAPQAQQEVRTSAYDRVIASRVLRCGYNFWEPGVMFDEATGKMKGAYVDIMDAIASATGLRVEWTEQVDWGQVPAALNAGKVDAMCVGYWANAKAGTQLAYTTATYYEGVRIYVREDDPRFDEHIAALNSPDITLAVIDDDLSPNIAREDVMAIGDGLNDLRQDNAALQQQVDSLRAVVAKQDSVIRQIANLSGFPLSR